jgi:beta-phosphoglucomutase-like phosphatase (HAD superfamily)
VWAPAATIERIRAELEAERATEGYAKRKEADARRRDQAQAEYVENFLGAVVTFLGFHESYTDLDQRLARAVTDHAPRSVAEPWPALVGFLLSGGPRLR